MMISAKITLSDGAVIKRLFNSFADLDEWTERHKEHYKQIEARTILPGEMRQGRECI